MATFEEALTHMRSGGKAVCNEFSYRLNDIDMEVLSDGKWKIPGMRIHNAINSNWTLIPTPEPTPKLHTLQEAVEAVLAGHKVYHGNKHLRDDFFSRTVVVNRKTPLHGWMIERGGKTVMGGE